MGRAFTIKMFRLGRLVADPSPPSADSLAEVRGWLTVAGDEADQCNVYRAEGCRLVVQYRRIGSKWVMTRKP